MHTPVYPLMQTGTHTMEEATPSNEHGRRSNIVGFLLVLALLLHPPAPDTAQGPINGLVH
jgi:hypothetical protein